MKKTIVLLVIVIVFIALGAFLYQQQNENKEKSQVVSIVDQAVQLIDEKGESAFPELRTSEWVYNDTYVFVWRLDGIRLVYPPDPAGEGKNMSALVDSNGKPIGQLFIQTAQKGSGWVEYMWPKPGQTIPSHKIAYIKRAQFGNETYLVGSGFYIT